MINEIQLVLTLWSLKPWGISEWTWSSLSQRSMLLWGDHWQTKEMIILWEKNYKFLYMRYNIWQLKIKVTFYHSYISSSIVYVSFSEELNLISIQLSLWSIFFFLSRKINEDNIIFWYSGFLIYYFPHQGLNRCTSLFFNKSLFQ